jgi:hypothetical protein
VTVESTSTSARGEAIAEERLALARLEAFAPLNGLVAPGLRRFADLPPRV